MNEFNKDVTHFLDDLNHPLRPEIDLLRKLVLDAKEGLVENIKWNGPNYQYHGEDRITMKIHPPKQIQIIFHRGAKKQDQPAAKLIQTDASFLSWKENDRAVATFKNRDEILIHRIELQEIVSGWISK
ncbi:MAG: DUF1801 domain-containing protein [Flavobacteriales bacterium]|nr:DUF1801 domain-containing protein [Flavobacteriales bacterium]